MRLFRKFKNKIPLKVRNHSLSLSKKLKHNKNNLIALGVGAGILTFSKYVFDEYHCENKNESGLRFHKIKNLAPMDQASRNLKMKFDRYATTEIDGEKLMSFEDFKNSFGVVKDSEMLKDLFELVTF